MDQRSDTKVLKTVGLNIPIFQQILRDDTCALEDVQNWDNNEKIMGENQKQWNILRPVRDQVSYGRAIIPRFDKLLV